jgi:hypothetical protein
MLMKGVSAADGVLQSLLGVDCGGVKETWENGFFYIVPTER